LAGLIALKHFAVNEERGDDMKKHLWKSVREITIAVGASVAAAFPAY
jgi:hypothetical protein